MSNVNKLADILSRSKAVMQKTEENHGNTSNTPTTTNEYGEKEIPNLTENFINKHSKTSTRSVAPQRGQYRNLKTSKMPKEVLDAMVNTPIDIPESPNHTFELNDVQDLVNESVPTQPTTFTGEHIPADGKSIREIVREEIGDVVREVVEEYLDKSLVTEDIKIKIGDTIFGGKLKPLPTKKKKRV
jgi:hypothetical protein